ncbi:MAG: hypothetical protein KAT78_07710, partial [Flavobacteriaceae bacterium]|nr:hypothetical protein [Flavobacteriaceae bacterium]
MTKISFTFPDIVKSEKIKGLKDLPISHNCNLKALEEIIRKGHIKKNYCKKMQDEIIYFFYAKPIYINKKKFDYQIFLLFKVVEKINYKR